MKKIYSVYILAAGLCVYMTISGYKAGAGANGWDCTGAETGLGNPTGCASGSGCHATSATSSIGVTIELDSTGGVPTTHYTGGKTYSVKISGKNNGTTSLPKFGLEMGAIKGSTAQTTPVNAGTWSSTCPASCKFTAAQAGNFVVNVVEHSTPITATTGSGGNGTTYVESFTWTAPAAGTGTVSIWGVINAVNNNGTNDTGDKWNTGKLVITEWPASTAVQNVLENAEMNVFPNPVADNFYLHLNNVEAGNYSLSVFDISGKRILVQNVAVSSNSQTENISSANWQQGVYKVVLEKDNFIKHLSVVKE